MKKIILTTLIVVVVLFVLMLLVGSLLPGVGGAGGHLQKIMEHIKGN